MKGIGAVKISDAISLIGHIIEDDVAITVCGIIYYGKFEDITCKEVENTMKKTLHEAQIHKIYKPVEVNYIKTKSRKRKVKP